MTRVSNSSSSFSLSFATVSWEEEESAVGQLGEGGERGWLLLWWESVSVCTIQQPGSNELKSCSVAQYVRVSSFKL